MKLTNGHHFHEDFESYEQRSDGCKYTRRQGCQCWSSRQWKHLAELTIERSLLTQAP